MTKSKLERVCAPDDPNLSTPFNVAGLWLVVANAHVLVAREVREGDPPPVNGHPYADRITSMLKRIALTGA